MSNWADDSKKWIIVAFALSAIISWYNLRNRPTAIPYDENLNFNSLLWIGGGVVMLFLVSLIFAGLLFSDVLNANSPLIGLPDLTQGFLPLIPIITVPLNSFLWQLFLVANAEEAVKFNVQTALYDWLDNRVGVEFAKFVGFGLPIIIWALMHTMLSYTTGNVTGQVFAAIGAGIVLTYVIWRTGSILSAILVHGFFNVILTLM